MEQKQNGAAETTETQKEEQESPLDSLLKKVSLFDPLEIPDYAGNIVEVSKDYFINYYLPKNATEQEKFHCFQAVRATGLSLLIPGECYFFKTGDDPIKLFTGYMAYLRKAYAAGLEHIEKPEIEFGNDPDGYPFSCTIKIQIKDREDMEWTTWFAEVAGTTKEGLNKRWKKAPIQMLIKCAIVNLLRLSGLVDFTMPYTVDEMPDPVVDGYRTLTETQLSAHDMDGKRVEINLGERDAADRAEEIGRLKAISGSKAEIGDVDAAHHQVDMNEFRRKYFKALAKRGMFQDECDGDNSRHEWQELTTGKASITDWGITEYSDAMDALSEIPLIPDPETPPAEAKPEGDTEAAGDTGGDDTQGEADEGQNDATETAEQDDTPASKATLKTLTDLVKTFPGAKYMTIRSDSFKERAKDVIGRWAQTIADLTEAEALAIAASLRDEKASILETGPRVTSETVGEEITTDLIDDWEPVEMTPEEEEAPGDDKPSMEATNEIYKVLAQLLPNAVNDKGDSIARATPQARYWITEAIGFRSPGIEHLNAELTDLAVKYLQGVLSDKQADALGEDE